MGTNSKASHQAYIAEPTSSSEDPEPYAQPPAPELPDTYLKLLYTAYGDGEGEGYIDPDEDPVGWYKAFAAASAEALEQAAEMDFFAEDDDVMYTPMVKALTAKALGQLTPGQLQQIAEAEGFEHAALVGLSGSVSHPLVHWLDPSYPAENPSKTHIQDVANARYQELAAGGEINGMTLAALHALEGKQAPSAAVTAADLISAQAALMEAALAYNKVKNTGPYAPKTPDTEAAKGAALLALIDAENALADASGPEVDAVLPVALAAARHQVDTAIEGTNFAGLYGGSLQVKNGQAFMARLAEHPEAGEGASLLSWQNQVQLLRHSTSAEARAKLEAMAGERVELAQKLAADRAAFTAVYDPDTSTFHLSADPVELANGVATLGQAASDYYDTAQSSKALSVHAGTDPAAVEKIAPGALAKMPTAQDLTTSFRAYAKTHKMAVLRFAATAAGLEHAESATRAQLQNYLAAGWDASLGKEKIAKAVSLVHQANNPAPATSTPTDLTSAPAASAASTPASSTATPTAIPDPAKPATATPTAAASPLTASTIKAAAAPASPFGRAKANLVAALAQHGAAHADVPARLPTSDFTAISFGPANTANLGGSHTKHLHSGSDGGTWLVKPDTTGGKWRASAESGGSAGYAAGGLLAIPVYAGTVDGKLSSVQPLLKGATAFSSTPSSWSQPEVDHVVRTAVGAWMIGDHDGKPDNLLRTAGGGLLPCDYGAAFKYYGSDKLALSYTPLTTTAFQTAIHAHKNGSLGAGVAVNPLVAHAAIKAYEQIPDAQWRTLLHDTAHQGAAGNAPWVSGMRERAAGNLGIPASQVSTAQVAEAFLDHAVERKSQLRATFADFFIKHGLGAGSLLKNLGS